MKTKIFTLLIALIGLNVLSFSQPTAQDWQNIKDTTAPQVMLPNEYDTPYHLAGSLGWEDGQTITRDGLSIYCYYSPMDLLSFSYPPCGSTCVDVCNVGPYRRGPYPEILDSVPPILQGFCTEFLSSDILWSHRNTLQDTFPALTPMNIQIPAAFEGAPSLILNSTNPSQVDYFVFAHLQPDSTLSSDNTGTIFWYKNTTLNPTGIYTALPSTINTDSTEEDNPYLERLNSSDFVLYFTSTNRQPAVGETDIYVSTSNDTGNTWTIPQLVNFNTTFFEDMPHIWQDSTGIWWMYYMDQNKEIVRRQQQTVGDWVNWGTPTTVIGKGNAFAVGEPTLTQWGDIVFGLVYDAGIGWGTDTTNRYDDDFWILPRKVSPLSVLGSGRIKIVQAKAYPNPFRKTTTIEFENINSVPHSLEIFDLSGILVYKREGIITGKLEISLNQLPSGTYIYRISTKNSQLKGGGKLIIK